MTKAETVDQYIKDYSGTAAERLNQIRSVITKAAPAAEELISYGLPTYKLNGKPLVYFGGFKTHIGFYAIPSSNEKFKTEISGYKTGKGSIQFPLDQPLPIALITKIVKFRIYEISKKIKK